MAAVEGEVDEPMVIAEKPGGETVTEEEPASEEATAEGIPISYI